MCVVFHNEGEKELGEELGEKELGEKELIFVLKPVVFLF